MGHDFNISEVDLAQVAAQLLRDFEGAAPRGAVVGRTHLRDAVVARLGCSELEGERVIDTMKGRGFLKLHNHPDGVEHWEIVPHTP